MKRVPSRVIAAYRGRVVNIHPALLPKFGGQGMYGIHVHEAVLAAHDQVSGATVHLVDEEYDRGPIVLQRTVPVKPDDTPETLAARVLNIEHELYPEALRLFAEGALPPSAGASGTQPQE
jgi:phosphoribosylglycinamide formyltransferase-1